jgi:hypothetical protein
MAHEVTIPILPCRNLEELLPFYESLGFAVKTRQTRPNPYASVSREDIQLHFFGLNDFEPESSYGSCIVVVPDADALYRSFTAGLRASRGRVPLSGIPRLTRPRKKQDTVYGFSVIDPGGNWIRIFQRSAQPDRPTGQGPLAKALDAAVVLGDSKGDLAAAAQVLDRALAREVEAPRVEQVRAWVYRAELAMAMGQLGEAAGMLLRVHGVWLEEGEREKVKEEMERVKEMEEELS